MNKKKPVFELRGVILGALMSMSICMMQLPFMFHFKFYGYAESVGTGFLLFVIFWIYFFATKKYKLVER
jgi:hypothetical protein